MGDLKQKKIFLINKILQFRIILDEDKVHTICFKKSLLDFIEFLEDCDLSGLLKIE